ncbi:ribosome assembly cofactor RimP [Brumimicrobium glaciale]|jgi:ribosome maturation factor RimP|uniref:Ribosome maturation factor RimP n=1 Tax=Brumimicrobium glaciale TaxID=200475 RepID=A0A4Q4KQ76_9FLAO|nr:ribosome assembly cofactor RimP [Brumimicrobium glaciale]RYM35670.1 ribosome assembly cofactor RimP [Brumimicrobium glaciale]
MLKKKIIEELAIERINELDKGLFIVEIAISSNNVIQVELDVEDGNVAINDCVSVSRNIEHNLDREEQDFELSVSSAGLDKPFRVLKQYIKNIGNEIKVQLKEKNNTIEGVLKHVDENGIKLETTSKERVEGKKKKEIVVQEHEYTFEEIKETKIVISFK